MPSILIIKINASSNTETFIEGHIKHIKYVRKVVYGRSELLYDNETNKLLTNEEKAWKRFQLKIQRILTGISYQEQLIRAQSRYIKKNNIDLIIAEYGLSGCHILEGARRAKVPLIVFFHGYDANNRETVNRYESRYAQLFEYASFIIGVSKRICARLMDYGAPEGKVVHLPYGVNLSKVQNHQNKTSEPTFIHVGRLINMKAPYLTILAFSKVIERIPSAKLKIVGYSGLEGETNPIAEACVHLVRSLKLTDKVEFLGNMSNEEVFKELSKAWIFVLHSITGLNGNAEGTPNVVLEAMASGLPVVSTKHEGIMDVVEDGISGYLVEEGDVDKMAFYMQKLASDPKLADKMGKAGRQILKERYSYDQYLNKVDKLVQRSISE